VEKGLAPTTQLVDMGYTSAEELVRSRSERGITLVGPVRAAQHWQAKEGQGYDLSAFTLDWVAQTTTCPQGKRSGPWKHEHDRAGHPQIQALFHETDCGPCAVRAHCTRSAKAPRQVTFHPQAVQEMLQAARVQQQTAEFKQVIAARAGIEGTMSQGVRAFELRQSRNVGLTKTHLQHIWIALAMNVVRLVAWWRGEGRAQTRVSPFAALALSTT